MSIIKEFFTGPLLPKWYYEAQLQSVNSRIESYLAAYRQCGSFRPYLFNLDDLVMLHHEQAYFRDMLVQGEARHHRRLAWEAESLLRHQDSQPVTGRALFGEWLKSIPLVNRFIPLRDFSPREDLSEEDFEWCDSCKKLSSPYLSCNCVELQDLRRSVTPPRRIGVLPSYNKFKRQKNFVAKTLTPAQRSTELLTRLLNLIYVMRLNRSPIQKRRTMLASIEAFYKLGVYPQLFDKRTMNAAEVHKLHRILQGYDEEDIGLEIADEAELLDQTECHNGTIVFKDDSIVFTKLQKQRVPPLRSYDVNFDYKDLPFAIVQPNDANRMLGETGIDSWFNHDDSILVCQPDMPVNQMDNEGGPHGDCDQLNIEQEQNVILTTHAEESIAKPIEVTTGIWEKLCSPQNVDNYAQLMDRWQQFDTISWLGSNISSTMIGEYNLPIDLIKMAKNSPNVQLLQRYGYMAADLEIKITLNSNPFMCGSLQASVYYGANSDAHSKDRRNVYSASQLAHCIVDASNSTDGILYIPYRHYKPLMGTTKRADDSSCLDMCTLRVMVLNQLKSVENNYFGEIDVSLFFRFKNVKLHGMKPTTIGENQMMGMANLVKETANLIQQIYPDPQRDNPTDVIPPKPMVPWSAHSWCIGDLSPSPQNVLRMQATGNTPHPPGTLPEEPEMTFNYIQSIYGLISIFKWSVENKKGFILKKIPFSPFFEYPQISVKNGRVSLFCDIMPPVSVLASFFGAWRGSLEYLLDFISTKYHTGRLIIAYLPRVVLDRDPTLSELTACDHIIVDLKEERQVVYTNSFLSDKPWYPRRRSTRYGAEKYPPGYIYIAVLNNLTCPKTVSKEIEINLYLRGGKDFEVHIPIAPEIGLSFNTDIAVPPTTELYTLPAYGPPQTDMYIGTWHGVAGKLVLRYGPGSDHVTQFSNKLPELFTMNHVFKLSQPANLHLTHPAYTVDSVRPDGTTQTSLVDFLFVVPFTIDNVYYYGAPFDTENSAKKFLAALKGYVCDANTCYNLMKDSKGKPDGQYVNKSEIVIWRPIYEVSDFVVISQAGDERKTNCGVKVEVQRPIASTQNGLLTFGEQISSIKPLLRRYQPYCQLISSGSKKNDASLADFAIPVLPQGLDFDPFARGNDYLNKIRDGPIPLLASGYRFFRGSVRFRFIIASQKEGVFWIQHRPDYVNRSLKWFVPDKKYKEAYFQPGYGYMIQLSQVNRVVEIEVPFYLTGQFGLLQRPNLANVEDAVHYSLGVLYCGFDVPSSTGTLDSSVGIQVFYAMGDDMSFSVFQGFPPMIPTIDFAEPQGPSDWVKGLIKDTGKELIKETIEDLSTAPTEALSKVDQLDGELAETIRRLFPELNKEKSTMIISTLTNLIHVAIHPKIETIAWSIASVLVHLGMVSFAYIERICSALKNFITSFPSLAKRAFKFEQAPSVVQNADDEDLRNEAALVSTLVSGFLALMGASDKPLPKTMPNFAKYLYDGLPKFTLTANGIFIFLRNNLMMFKKMWRWLVSFFFSDYALYAEIEDARADVVDTIRQIQWCLDADNERRVRTEPEATTRVYRLANIAQAFLAKKAVSKIQRDMPIVENYMRKIITLKDTLSREMLSPAIRFEPFVISFNGASNCGKSHLAQAVAKELLASIDYKSYDELVYTRTPGNAYWNGLRNQPVCLFDDFLNIEDPTFAHISIGELFCLKSKAVFNPPMAAVEEKKLRYNPLLVLLCNNTAYPQISGLACQEAWMRRRDVLIEAEKLDAYAGIHPRAMPNKIKSTYGHLRFRFYVDPAGVSNADRQLIGPWMTYQELLPVLIERFHTYFYEECAQFNRALNDLIAFYPRGEETTIEYAKRMEEEALRISNERVPEEDMALINELVRDFRSETFKSEAVYYIKKQLLKKKITVLKEEKTQADKLKLIPALPPGVPSTSMAIAQAGMNWVMWNEFALCEQFYNQCVSKYRMPSTRLCTCTPHIYNIVSISMDGDEVVVQCNISTFIKYGSTSEIMKTLKLSGCGDSCILHTPLAQHLWESTIIRSTSYLLPDNIAKWKPCGKDEIKLMSVHEIDDKIQQELGSPSWYEKLWAKLPTWGNMISWLLRIGALFASLGLMIRSVGFLFSSRETAQAEVVKQTKVLEYYKTCDLKDAVFEPKQVIPVGEEAGKGYSVGTVGRKPNPLIKPKVIGQASSAMEDVICRKIIRNTFWLLVEKVDQDGVVKFKSYRCLGIKDHYFIMLDHYVYCMNDGTVNKIFFVQQGMRVEISMDVLQGLRKLEHSTFVIGKMHKTIPPFCNIKKFFINSKMTGNLPPQADLYEYVLDTEVANPVFKMKVKSFDRVLVRHRLDIANDNGSVSTLSSVYVYPYGGRGVCGSVLVTTANIPNPILGIHVAGLTNNSEGYSEALVQESFDGLCFDEPQIIENSATPVVLLDEPMMLPLDGNVELIGCIPKKITPRMPIISQHALTECVDQITPRTYDFPVLSPKDSRLPEPFSPLLEGVRNHTSPILPMPQEFVNRAVADVTNMILSVVQPRRFTVGKLSLQEAICGVQGNEEYEPMAMDTSEGFPWTQYRPKGCSNKSWMFTRELTAAGWRLDGIVSVLETTLREKEKNRQNRKYYESVYVDTLKDIKLPKEKVLKKGATRIFSICPVDVTIQQRQYMLDFSVAYTAARVKAEHGVGIDISSLESNNLVEHMLEYGNNMVCGDYSKFGDRLYAPLVLEVFRIIGLWYRKFGNVSQEYVNVIDCFAYETAYSVQLMGNVLYRTLCGMPSGCPLTVIINSIINCIYIRIVWQEIMYTQNLHYLSLDAFHENCRLMTYGDDLWISVKDECIEKFNAESIASVFAGYGIKFTNATKSNEIVPFTRIDDPDTTFLKCRFVRHQLRSNIWMAQLDERSVLEICNWTWKTQRDLRAASIEACKAMCLHAFGHGEVYHNILRQKCIDYWSGKGVYITIPDWRAIDLRIYGDAGIIKNPNNLLSIGSEE
uniref:Genome polyprotein n=3 Tax=unclassified Iflavirus TaxID=336476 RepID=A0AB38ZJR5_9VIRU